MGEAAGTLARAGALLADLGPAFAVAASIARLSGQAPVPSWSSVLLLASGAVTSFALCRLVFERTLGEALWGLRPASGEFLDRFSLRLLRADARGAGLGTILKTAIALLLGLGAVAGIYASHPLLTRADRWFVTPSAEALTQSTEGAAAEAGVSWGIAPFFYALGAWPTRFEGKPVFHSVPYEKGPPTRFIGHVIAKWDVPDVRLIFEGPRTPENLATGVWQRSNLEDCLVSELSAPKQLSARACLELRLASLDRHLKEFERAGLSQVTARWLVVKNPALPAKDNVQGIYLSGTSQLKGQDRFILVMPNGASQTFILEYKQNAAGDRAKEVFLSSIRSLRVSNDLAQGRRWSDERIQEVRLDELNQITDGKELVARIAEIQMMLISRLSVDPKTFDTYFHLAGTASLLARQASKQKHDEWTAAAKSVIDSVYRFSKDVAPDDPRSPQLEGLWLALRKN